jgi:hypothetical protein
MQILSYKILNEAINNRYRQVSGQLGGNLGRDIFKSSRIAKGRGLEGADEGIRTITDIVGLTFNFYKFGSVNQPFFPNVFSYEFGVYFSDSNQVAHLYPYIGNEIIGMPIEELENYASLSLYTAISGQNITYNPLDIRNVFTQKNNGNYYYSLGIGSDFQNLNKGKYSNLNNLLGQNPPLYGSQVNTNYYVGLVAQEFRRIDNTQSSTQQNRHQISFTFNAQQLPTNVGNIIRNFNTPQSSIVNLNLSSRPSGFGNRPNTIPIGYYYTNIITQNYDILFAHQGMINVRTMLNNPINCFIEIRNVTPGPIQGTLNITNFV